MIYTELVKIAMRLACSAHQGQYDKAGYPYIHHPMHLAEQMGTELETVVALLHDVAEDTSVSFAEMQAYGIPEEAIRPLRLLCHEKDVPYEEYIDRMRHDPVALRVKRADLLHNLDSTRILGTDPAAFSRREKYFRALTKVEQYLKENFKKI